MNGRSHQGGYVRRADNSDPRVSNLHLTASCSVVCTVLEGLFGYGHVTVGCTLRFLVAFNASWSFYGFLE
jgi:hypothetical protein